MNIISQTLKKQNAAILITVAVDIAFLAVVFIWNKYLAGLIDYVVAGNHLTKRMIIQFIAILLVHVLMSALSAFTSGFTCEKINYTLRQNYLLQTSSRNYEYLSSVSAGQGASVLLNELNAVCNFISNNLFFLFDSAVKFIGTFGWFLILNPVLAISSNLPSIAILFYVSATSKILKKYTVQANQEKSKLNGITESLMNLFPVIRLYEANKMILENYTQVNQKWVKLTASMEKKKALLMSLSAILTCIPLILTILIGGKLIINGKMTVGELYIFINLSGSVSGILMNMPAFILDLRVFSGNVKKVNAC